MRRLTAVAILGVACLYPNAWAEEAFDACDIFTQGDAEAALGIRPRRSPSIRR